VLVLISALADPPRRHRVSPDPYRPKLDHYYCKCQGLTYALMYILVVWHVLVSVSCVIKVRNGLEAFKDGMIIKESFVILYTCVLVAFILQNLGLNAADAYMLRSNVISFGVTAFLCRLLINRCIRHWTPKFLQRLVANLNRNYLQPVLSRHVAATGHSSHHSKSDHLFDDEGPLYVVEAPQDSNLNDMINVMNDPARNQMFRDVAQKFLLNENVDFLMDVLALQRRSEEEILSCSAEAGVTILEKARALYKKYIVTGAESEVNVSSATKAKVEKLLRDWPLSKPILNQEQATTALEMDEHKRGRLFEPAYKEILVMLYQNIWQKFRTFEAEALAGSSDVISTSRKTARR